MEPMIALGCERLVLRVKNATFAGTVVRNLAFKKPNASRKRETQTPIHQLQPASAGINNPTDQMGYDLGRELLGITAVHEGGVAAPGRTVATVIHIGFE